MNEPTPDRVCRFIDGVWEPVSPQPVSITNPSDEYHPVLGFDGDASDTLDGILRNMHGYGVTLTLEDGSEIEAMLGEPWYDEATNRLMVQYHHVKDVNDWPVAMPEQVDVGFVRRIQVS